MADVVAPSVRSRMMAGIRARNTTPEMILRRGLHKAGLRFRLHSSSLPGRPDLVFPRRKAVLFAHGCFWHGHDCHLFRLPQTRREFWSRKIERNHFVDARSVHELITLGWRVGIVWECALKGRSRWQLNEVIDACASWILGSQQRFEIREKSDVQPRPPV